MNNLVFQEILNDIRINNVDIAKKKWEKLTKNTKNEIKDFKLLFLNSIFLFTNGEFEEAKDILEKIVTSSKDDFITYLSFISLIEIKINLGKFGEAEAILSKAYEIQNLFLSNEFEYEKIDLEYRKSILYFKKGLYNEEIQNLEDLLKSRINFSNSDQLKFLKNSINQNLAIAYKTQGKFEKSLQMLKDVSLVYQKFAPCTAYVRCLSATGLIYQDIGDLDKGLEFQFKGLDVCNKIDDKQIISLLYTNIASIYNEMGEIDQGLEYALKSYELKLQIGNYYSLGLICGNLSQLYKQKGIKDLALDFMKEAFGFFERINHKQYMVFTLLDLIELTVNYNSDNEIALGYFLKIDEFYRNESSFIFDQFFQLAQAIIKKYQKNGEQVLESKNLFISFIKREGIQKKLIVDAIFELMEIYASELETKQDEKSFNQINIFLEKIKKELHEYNSYFALVSIYIIQSKLYASTLAIDDAKNVLKNALIITEVKGLTGFTKRLQQEQNNLLTIVKNWASKAREEISLYQRLKDTQILQYIININRGKAGSWGDSIRV